MTQLAEGYHTAYSQLTWRLVKPVVHPKDSAKLCPLRNVFMDFGSFLFQTFLRTLIMQRSHHRNPYKRNDLPWSDWFCTHEGSDWGARSPVGALAREQPWLRHRRAALLTVLSVPPELGLSKKLTLQLKKRFWTCSKQSLCFPTARSNVNWMSKIRQHEFPSKHHRILVEKWKMEVETWQHQKQTPLFISRTPTPRARDPLYMTDLWWSLTCSKDQTGLGINKTTNKVQKNVIFIRRLRDQSQTSNLFQQKPTYHPRILA